MARRPVSGRDLSRLASILVVHGLGALPARRGAAGSGGRSPLARLAAVTDFLQPGWRARGGRALARALGPREDTRELLRQGYRQLWLDLLALYRPDAPAVPRHYEIVRMEHLRVALAAGRGAVLLESSGFGLRYAANRILHDQGVRLCQVHGPRHLGGETSWLAARWLRRGFERAERRFVAEVVRVPADGSLAYTRVLVDWLRAGGVVCLSGDGRMGGKLVEQPLLGATWPFSSGWASLARVTGAALVPLFAWEEPPGRLRLVVEPPLAGDPSGGREAATRAAIAEYAGRLERQVRRRPGLFVHWQLLPAPAGR